MKVLCRTNSYYCGVRREWVWDSTAVETRKFYHILMVFPGFKGGAYAPEVVFYENFSLSIPHPFPHYSVVLLSILELPNPRSNTILEWHHVFQGSFSSQRFIIEDSYKGQIDNPPTLNLYTYVHNNPLSNIDSSGHYCVSADGKYAHGGDCHSSSSVYLGEDSQFQGRPVIESGAVKSCLGSSGNIPVQASGNYWDTFEDDKMFLGITLGGIHKKLFTVVA